MDTPNGYTTIKVSKDIHKRIKRIAARERRDIWIQADILLDAALRNAERQLTPTSPAPATEEQPVNAAG